MSDEKTNPNINLKSSETSQPPTAPVTLPSSAPGSSEPAPGAKPDRPAQNGEQNGEKKTKERRWGPILLAARVAEWVHEHSDEIREWIEDRLKDVFDIMLRKR